MYLAPACSAAKQRRSASQRSRTSASALLRRHRLHLSSSARARPGSLATASMRAGVGARPTANAQQVVQVAGNTQPLLGDGGLRQLLACRPQGTVRPHGASERGHPHPHAEDRERVRRDRRAVRSGGGEPAADGRRGHRNRDRRRGRGEQRAGRRDHVVEQQRERDAARRVRAAARRSRRRRPAQQGSHALRRRRAPAPAAARDRGRRRRRARTRIPASCAGAYEPWRRSRPGPIRNSRLSAWPSGCARSAAASGSPIRRRRRSSGDCAGWRRRPEPAAGQERRREPADHDRGGDDVQRDQRDGARAVGEPQRADQRGAEAGRSDHHPQPLRLRACARPAARRASQPGRSTSAVVTTRRPRRPCRARTSGRGRRPSDVSGPTRRGRRWVRPDGGGWMERNGWN